MDQEAISNEAIGFAHVENFALKIFLSADNEDLNAGSTKYITFNIERLLKHSWRHLCF